MLAAITALERDSDRVAFIEGYEGSVSLDDVIETIKCLETDYDRVCGLDSFFRCGACEYLDIPGFLTTLFALLKTDPGKLEFTKILKKYPKIPFNIVFTLFKDFADDIYRYQSLCHFRKSLKSENIFPLIQHLEHRRLDALSVTREIIKDKDVPRLLLLFSGSLRCRAAEILQTRHYEEDPDVIHFNDEKVSVPQPALVLVPTFTYPNKGEDVKVTDNTKDEDTCLICFERVRKTINLPCGHICYCFRCTKELGQRETKNCALCRAQLTSVQPFYKV